MNPESPRSAITSDPAAAKQAMRDRIRAGRRSRTDEERRADAELLAERVLALPEVEAARCVTAYVSMRYELGTGPLRAALRSAGIRVLLPVVLPGGILDWGEDTGVTAAPPGFGGEEPVGPRLGPEAIAQADVVLAPALAIDTTGRRLGQGAAYYDRALRYLRPGRPVMALVHDHELLNAATDPVPTEPHDLPVDAVVTPRRTWRVSRPGGA
jgi:5-formyltetrahydrofolate cyclo-ligase